MANFILTLIFQVINWRDILTIPPGRLEQEAEDLILRLCTHPDDRLGKDGAEEIKEHPYFSGVDFQLLHQEVAPYIPTINHATDTSNFDPVPENMIEDDSEEHDEQKNVSATKEGPEYAFYEFTFRHFFDDGGLVNPNTEFSDVNEAVEPPKQASKRSATQSNNSSISVPSKVSATSTSISEDKAPIYV